MASSVVTKTAAGAGSGTGTDTSRALSHGRCRSVSCFSKGEKIGEGTYGSVYQARDKASGALVALKRVKLGDSTFDREGMPVTHLREVSILRALQQHTHIVRMIEVVVGSSLDSVYLVFEYVPHDLSRLIDTMATPFELAEVKCLMVQLLLAVAHLHDNFILHRDLKLSNLLLTADGTLKVCDFGLARRYDGNHEGVPRDAPPLPGPVGGTDPGGYTPKVVTLWYRSPELLLGERRYGSSVDMWSVGCMLGELLLHTPLLPGDTEVPPPFPPCGICALSADPTEGCPAWIPPPTAPTSRLALGAVLRLTPSHWDCS